MVAKKCDRCGDFYIGSLENRLILEDDTETWDFDICDDCFNEISDQFKRTEEVENEIKLIDELGGN